MMFDKVHDIFYFRQSKWLEKDLSFNTKKKKQ